MLFALSFCLVTGGLLPAWSQGVRAADEKAIREVVQKYLEARERGDAQAIEALFTADADQLVSSED